MRKKLLDGSYGDLTFTKLEKILSTTQNRVLEYPTQTNLTKFAFSIEFQKYH